MESFIVFSSFLAMTFLFGLFPVLLHVQPLDRLSLSDRSLPWLPAQGADSGAPKRGGSPQRLWGPWGQHDQGVGSSVV